MSQMTITVITYRNHPEQNNTACHIFFQEFLPFPHEIEGDVDPSPTCTMRGWGSVVVPLFLCAGLQLELARNVSKAAGHPNSVIVLLCAASLLGAVALGARLSAPFTRLDALTEPTW
jgi:hypothetical protein